MTTDDMLYYSQTLYENLKKHTNGDPVAMQAILQMVQTIAGYDIYQTQTAQPLAEAQE